MLLAGGAALATGSFVMDDGDDASGPTVTGWLGPAGAGLGVFGVF